MRMVITDTATTTTDTATTIMGIPTTIMDIPTMITDIPTATTVTATGMTQMMVSQNQLALVLQRRMAQIQNHFQTMEQLKLRLRKEEKLFKLLKRISILD